jgi:predicted RNase H-like HicB family nuclease
MNTNPVREYHLALAEWLRLRSVPQAAEAVAEALARANEAFVLAVMHADYGQHDAPAPTPAPTPEAPAKRGPGRPRKNPV